MFTRFSAVRVTWKVRFSFLVGSGELLHQILWCVFVTLHLLCYVLHVHIHYLYYMLCLFLLFLFCFTTLLSWLITTTFCSKYLTLKYPHCGTYKGISHLILLPWTWCVCISLQLLRVHLWSFCFCLLVSPCSRTMSIGHCLVFIGISCHGISCVFVVAFCILLGWCLFTVAHI